ncbi:hypothetical protein [uncultured Ruegeria sp.]|uniref:hypothetical protein n=1 Tax=uncultured Ruegeria sp. TaxID=259304 RepID=UPI00345C570B
MGAGQFCTNPGLVFLPEGSAAKVFSAEAAAALADASTQTMLSGGIADDFYEGRDRIASVEGVETGYEGIAEHRTASAFLYRVTVETFAVNPALAHGVFGLLGVVVVTQSVSDFDDLARAMMGQLTATIHMDGADLVAAARLLPILERMAGRFLFNGFPIGVKVTGSMVHGGPYPASTNFGATSVGTLSIRRFLRPVCYQNSPDHLLPDQT